jgi:hypothetical protein
MWYARFLAISSYLALAYSLPFSIQRNIDWSAELQQEEERQLRAEGRQLFRDAQALQLEGHRLAAEAYRVVFGEATDQATRAAAAEALREMSNERASTNVQQATQTDDGSSSCQASPHNSPMSAANDVAGVTTTNVAPLDIGLGPRYTSKTNRAVSFFLSG